MRDTNKFTKQYLTRVKKALKEKEIDLQTIDFESLDTKAIDTFEASMLDNYKIDLNEILHKTTKAEVVDQLDQIKEEEEQQLVNAWLKERTMPLLKNTLYDTAKTYTQMVIKQYAYGVIILSPTALGKTSMVLNMIDKLQYEYISTKTTPLGLYIDLYNNKDRDIIVLDDMESILDSIDGLKLLMACLWPSKENKRVVNYSTSKKLEVPKRFEIKARIIMLVNDLNKSKISTLLSRVLYCELNPTHKEKISLLYEMSERKYKDLEYEARVEVVSFIEEITTEATANLNLRTLIKGYEFRRFSLSKWKQLISKELRVDERKAILLQLLESDLTSTQRLEEWNKKSGLNKTQYYHYKKQLVR